MANSATNAGDPSGLPRPLRAELRRGVAAAGGEVRPARQARSQARATVPARRTVRQPWTRSQEKLALLYNEQGLRPAEIAGKLGVTSHLVTQIILAAKNRGKA